MQDCYKSKAGRLKPSDVKKWLNILLSKLKDEGIKYWLIGGVMEAIHKCKGVISHDHGDIDFLILERDKKMLAEESGIGRFLMSKGFSRPNQSDIKVKMQYTHDSNGSADQSYSIEFILLKSDCNSRVFCSATTTSNKKCYPKNVIGAGKPYCVGGVKKEIMMPNLPDKFLKYVKYTGRTAKPQKA